MIKLNFQNRQKGISLYLALLILGILLAIGLAISAILLGQIKMIKGMGDSVVAFYAADTGIEKALDVLYETGTGSLPFSYSGSVGDAQYSVNGFPPGGSDCPSPPNEFFCIKSVGIYKGIRRSIEAAR